MHEDQSSKQREHPLLHMRQILPSLSGVNATLAEWFIELASDDNLIPLDFTSTTIANLLNVSRASVVRFARHIGYDGFPEFRSAILLDLGQDKALSALPVEDSDHVLHQITRKAIITLETALHTIDRAVFTDVVALMLKSPLIVWYGLGDSAFYAASADHKSAIAGLSTKWVSDAAQMTVVSRSLIPDSIVICITQSGQWSIMADSLRECQRKGFKIICITSRPSSIMGRMADYKLITPATDIFVSDHPFTIRCAQNILTDSLILAATLQKGLLQCDFGYRNHTGKGRLDTHGTDASH